MPLFLIPLVSLLSAIFLLNLDQHGTRLRSVRVISIAASFIILIMVAVYAFGTADFKTLEYQFSPLFLLPGMSETLSFSLFADPLAIEWLLLISLATFFINFLSLPDHSADLNIHLAILHLTHAGLAIFFLSGSPVTGIIGWGMTLAAVLIASNTTRHAGKSNSISYFTLLMFPVFLLLAAAFLLYGVTGRLSYSNNPESMEFLLRTLLGVSYNPLVLKVLNLTSVFLLFAILPGLGLAPFTAWLSNTRDMHPMSALLVFSCVMPAGILIMQRYQWLFGFTPLVRLTAVTISILSLLMACIAIFSSKATRPSLIWPAVACTSMLFIVQCLSQPPATSLLLKALYPGLFIFGFGRSLDIDYNRPIGRKLRTAGIFLPVPVTILQYLTNHQIGIRTLFFTGIPALIFTILALILSRSSTSTETNNTPSPLGLSAYRFFDTYAIIHYGFTWPVQQLADGFLVLESGISLFWSHGLPRLVCNWSRLLWLFDKWFFDGASRLLRLRNRSELPNQKKHGNIAGMLLVFATLSMLCRNLVKWI